MWDKEAKKLIKLPHYIRLRLCEYIITKKECTTKHACKESVSYCSKWEYSIDPFIQFLLINKKAGEKEK
jgi:hypothetical protein